MTRCIWCGAELNSERLYCDETCKVSQRIFKKEMELTKQMNKDPNQFVKGMLEDAVIKPAWTREKKIQNKIIKKYGIIYRLDKNIEPLSFNQVIIGDFYKDIYCHIKKMERGGNVRIIFKDYPDIKIQKIRRNLRDFIFQKTKQPEEFLVQKKENCLFVMRNEI